jgi:putative RecB family exonuclease
MIVKGEPCKQPEHISPSSIGTWQQCPLRFRYSRIDRIPEPSTEPQILGSFVHEVLEFLYALPAEERTKQRARQLASQLWDEKWSAEAEQLNLDPDELHQFRWRSWWCIESLWQLEEPTQTNLAGIEQRLEMHIGDAKLIGILDRYEENQDGSIRISDYKTGKKPKPQYEADKKFQLTVYADLVEKTLGHEVNGAELLYLKDGFRWEYNPTKSEIEEMRKTVTEVWEAIKVSCSTGEFEAKPTILCNWCSYKVTCPAHVK